MAIPNITIKSVGGAFGKERGQSPVEQFRGRESNEIILGFSGPVGSGVDIVIGQTRAVLESMGYECVDVKLSDHIKQASVKELIQRIELEEVSSFTRILRLQDGGNELRKKFEDDILAQYAVSAISTHRIAKSPETPVSQQVPGRVAYLIDQLKHPREVNLLRAVYGNLFFLIGVLSIYEKRLDRLKAKEMTKEEAEKLMEKDRKEADVHGQQLDKTLHLADFFIRNSAPNVESLKPPLERFLNLAHGKNGITPTRHEYGMYAAYSAGLKSACLSRQVGASILDKGGNILATGTNDVPRFGGGLYGPEDGEHDARCVHMDGGKCFNDDHKIKLMHEIEKVIEKQLPAMEIQHAPNVEKSAAILPPASDHQTAKEIVRKIADQIFAQSRIKDLIEFSRSVHAEMEAIISVARQGGTTVVGSTLYTTTFPCHNCARHIVAAGICEVHYIEPYEKSLAVDLHKDAIELDDKTQGPPSRVKFIHYEGLHPRQYINFFLARSERKEKSGKAIKTQVYRANKVAPQYLDSYFDFESKVVEHLQKIEGGAKS
jgi:deoxycytidylate deaminase